MITYLKRDATQPVRKPAVIVHVCNDIGAWGAGFVMALSRRWPEPEKAYRGWKNASDALVPDVVPFELGRVQFVRVESNIFVANMIGQHNVGIRGNQIPLRYDAVEKCLDQVYKNKYEETVLRGEVTVHMPRIGCGLAGGKWEEIEKILCRVATLDTFVYDF